MCSKTDDQSVGAKGKSLTALLAGNRLNARQLEPIATLQISVQGPLWRSYEGSIRAAKDVYGALATGCSAAPFDAARDV